MLFSDVVVDLHVNEVGRRARDRAVGDVVLQGSVRLRKQRKHFRHDSAGRETGIVRQQVARNGEVSSRVK